MFIISHNSTIFMYVHFTRLENKIGAAVERGHLLIDIIQNLDLFSENVSLRIGHFLVNQIW